MRGSPPSDRLKPILLPRKGGAESKVQVKEVETGNDGPD